MKTQAIIAAAGTGTRMEAKTVKAMLPLCGRPMLLYALDIFERCPSVDSVIVLGFSERLVEYKRVISGGSFQKVKAVISGGETRRDSVQIGLKALDQDTEIVVIHDGARPLVTEPLIEDSIRACVRESAVVVGVPVKPTIKRVDPQRLEVEATFNRSMLWEIQTPQTFRRELICRAYFSSDDRQATDDASLVEQLGVKVKVIKGDYRNIKVTTPEDLIFAEALLPCIRSV